MWFGAGFFSIRRMARRIAPLLISLRGAARKVPNFAQPIILAYETYASAKISRHSVRKGPNRSVYRHSFREEICCSRSLSLITWILSLSYIL